MKGKVIWCHPKAGGVLRKQPEECEECPDNDDCKNYQTFLTEKSESGEVEQPEPDVVDTEAREEDMLPFLADDDSSDDDASDSGKGLWSEDGDDPSDVEAAENDEDRATDIELPAEQPEPAKDEDAAGGGGWTFVRTEEVSPDKIACDSDDMTRPLHENHVAHLVESADHFDIEIIVDEALNMVSGRHRLKAARELGLDGIRVHIYKYASPGARLRHAIRENVSHGLPYTQEEKKALGLRLFEGGATTADISTCLAVTERAVRKWTKSKRDKKREKLAAEARSLSESGATQEEIAEELGVSRNVLRSVLGENGTCSEITKDEDGERSESSPPDETTPESVHAGDENVQPDQPEEDVDTGEEDETGAAVVDGELQAGGDHETDEPDRSDVGGQVGMLLVGASEALTKAADLLNSMPDGKTRSAAELLDAYDDLGGAAKEFAKAWTRWKRSAFPTS